MHLWPRGRRNLGPFQDVPKTGHPHRLELNRHHPKTRQMAATVPGDTPTRHHPQANGGTPGGLQGTRPQCRLHLATDPRGRPPGHGNAHATDGRCQDSGAAHISHPQIPTACSRLAGNRPSRPPQTPVLQDHENLPHDIPPNTGPPQRLHTIHQAQHQHGTQEHHKHRTNTHQHARARSPHSPSPPFVHSHRQPPATACPLCVRQRLPQTALPCNPDEWVCLRAAHRLTRCPHCGDLNSQQPRAARRPSRTPPPPRQPPQLLRPTHRRPPRPPGRVLRGRRGEPWPRAAQPCPPIARPCATAGAA